jgi:hypothetical protein
MMPVLRAETFYRPPHPLPENLWEDSGPAERVFRWYEQQAGRRAPRPHGPVEGRLWARINHNRWVADCPCGSAQVVSPADPKFACTECGYGWAQLIFPDDVAAVEALLDELLPHERNWSNPDEPAVSRPPRPVPQKGGR